MSKAVKKTGAKRAGAQKKQTEHLKNLKIPVKVSQDNFNVKEPIHFTFPEMPYKTVGNYRNRPTITRYETNTMPSETVPDQSLTVQELIYRFTHGKVTEKIPVYDSEVDFEMPANWKSLDLAERMDWLAQKRDEYAELSELFKKEQDLIIQREREAEIERRVNEKMEANQKAREKERVQSLLFKDEQ